MTKPFNPVPRQCRHRGRRKWEVDCRPWGKTMKALGEPNRRRFESRAEALSWCQDLVIAQRTGRKLASPEAAVSGYIERYLRSCDRSHLAPTTVRHYGFALAKVFLPFTRSIGVDYMDQVTPGAIEEYRQYLVTRYAPNTAHNYMTALKSAFSWGLKLRLFDSNPVQGLVPPAPPSDRRSLTDQERHRVLHEARYRDVWFTYLLTGLRASELAELPTDSVKLDTPAPHLVVVGKGSKERIVPIHGHDAVSHFRKLVADARVRRDSRLMPWRTQRVQGLWRQDRELLGLPEDITIHTFRHTYGTFMAYRDLVGTQRAMGHSDIKTTMLYGAMGSCFAWR